MQVAPSMGVKRPLREADYWPVSSAKFKNKWSYTSFPTYTFMACTGKFYSYKPEYRSQSSD